MRTMRRRSSNKHDTTEYKLQVRYVRSILESDRIFDKSNFPPIIPTNKLKKLVKEKMKLDGESQENIDLVTRRGFLQRLHWMSSKDIISRHNANGAYAWGKAGLAEKDIDDQDDDAELEDGQEEEVEEEEKEEAEVDTTVEDDPDEDSSRGISKAMLEHDLRMLKMRVKTLEGHSATFAKNIVELENQNKELQKVRKVEFTITLPDKEKVVLKGKRHQNFEQVLFHIKCGDSVMLVGPKGCGKTFLAEQIAEALKRPFGFISLSGGTTETKLYGRSTPNITTGKNEYHQPEFAKFYETGGVYLLDEIDAADPNVLLSLNNPLANGMMALDRPKNPIVKRHPKFVCMSAANTWGHGADRQYVGRNQQDSAFVERFVQIDMDYDKALELELCPGRAEMVERLQRYRENTRKNRLERTISTRFITRAYNWMKNGKDDAYIDEMLFKGWRPDEVTKTKGGY